MSNPLKKTMVYLGLADEELEYDDSAGQNQQQSVAPVHNLPTANRSSVTPFRRSVARNVPPSEMNEILTVHPRKYRDAKVIAESFREGTPVIINLSQMSDADARRLIDFASGLSEGLYGKIERVTNKVFLLSPSHIAVSGDTAGSGSSVETERDTESTSVFGS